MGTAVTGRATTDLEHKNNQRTSEPALRCRITLRDGRRFAGELPPERHRAIQLGVLHRYTHGLVELTPGTRDLGGRLHVDRRSRPEHYLPGGACDDPRWLARLLEHARQIVFGGFARMRFDHRPREEVFVGVAERDQPRGSKDAVSQARWLWVDVDRSDRLEVLWDFLAERPCHLLVETAGSGGVHAYWQLDRPLPAKRGDRESIEQANLRIIHELGEGVADPQCKERSRVLRLAGTVNFKSGNYARIIEANLALPPYDPRRLVGDLADPPQAAPLEATVQPREGRGEDPYKHIPALTYFSLLAGITVPASGGLVRCPAHDDEHPSCSVSSQDPVWKCHACGAGGTIYDLASAVLGGPTGAELRGRGVQASEGICRRHPWREGRTMNLAGVHAGDVVLADRKGRRFYALVCGRGQGELQVEPIDRQVAYHQVKAREVVGIWHKRRRRNASATGEANGAP